MSRNLLYFLWYIFKEEVLNQRDIQKYRKRFLNEIGLDWNGVASYDAISAMIESSNKSRLSFLVIGKTESPTKE